MRRRRLERKQQPLLSRWGFAKRLLWAFLASVVLVGVSLAAGMAGYMRFEGLGACDAFANAAMILSGMGALDDLETPAGKVFAGSYALSSGLALVLAAGLILTPVFHRILHGFHLEEEGD